MLLRCVELFEGFSFLFCLRESFRARGRAGLRVNGVASHRCSPPERLRRSLGCSAKEGQSTKLG